MTKAATSMGRGPVGRRSLSAAPKGRTGGRLLGKAPSTTLRATLGQKPARRR